MERRFVFITGGAIVVVVAFFVIWISGVGRNPGVDVKLTEITDAAIIQRTIELSHLSIWTSETFAGNIRIRNITGVLTNTAAMPVRKIDLKMTFSDYDGKTVQESTHTAFSPRRKPLEPGTQFRFEVNFENLPRTWNYHVPKTEVVRVGY